MVVIVRMYGKRARALGGMSDELVARFSEAEDEGGAWYSGHLFADSMIPRV